MEEREERDEYKERKEEPCKRGKEEMNTEGETEEPGNRGKKGMNNKEGKDEPWQREKAKPEQRKRVWPITWKRKNNQKHIKSSLCSFFFFEGFPFPLYWSHFPPFFRV